MVATRVHPHLGGVETHVAEVAPRLLRAGIDITILSTDDTGTRPAFELVNGVPVRRVRAWPAGSDYAFAPGVYGEIARGSYDIVHCEGYHTLVPPLAMLAARRTDIPLIVSFHSGGHSSRFRRAVRGLQLATLRPLLARAAALVAVSGFEADLFQRQLRTLGPPIVIIPNGSDLPSVQAARGAGAGALIVSIGRVERYKGHQRLIRALPLVAAEVPEVRLRIVGDGPYQPALESLASRLGVSDRVEIRAVSGADRAELARVLAGASLVTVLSDYESQGIAVLEALALGRPVLVTYTSALREFADHGMARAVAANANPDEVAAGVIEQLRNPISPAPTELPTWDGCARQLALLYHAVARQALAGLGN